MEEFNSQEFFHREFALRSFARTISLPSPVYVDQADAEMKQGILTISLKKVVEEKPRTAKLTIKSIDYARTQKNRDPPPYFFINCLGSLDSLTSGPAKA